MIHQEGDAHPNSCFILIALHWHFWNEGQQSYLGLQRANRLKCCVSPSIDPRSVSGRWPAAQRHAHAAKDFVQ